MWQDQIFVQYIYRGAAAATNKFWYLLKSKPSKDPASFPYHKLIKSTQTGKTWHETKCCRLNITLEDIVLSFMRGPFHMTNCLLGVEEVLWKVKRGIFRQILCSLTSYHICITSLLHSDVWEEAGIPWLLLLAFKLFRDINASCSKLNPNPGRTEKCNSEVNNRRSYANSGDYKNLTIL